MELLRGKKAAKTPSSSAHATGATAPTSITGAPHIHESAQDNFDHSKCLALLHRINELGVPGGDWMRVHEAGIVFSIEEFFDGNDSVGSFATNARMSDEDADNRWVFEMLRSVESRPDVERVLVQVCDLNVFEDAAVQSWPYSDTAWVYTSAPLEAVREWLADLPPDDIAECCRDSGSDCQLPLRAPTPTEPNRAVRIWWD